MTLECHSDCKIKAFVPLKHILSLKVGTFKWCSILDYCLTECTPFCLRCLLGSKRYRSFLVQSTLETPESGTHGFCTPSGLSASVLHFVGIKIFFFGPWALCGIGVFCCLATLCRCRSFLAGSTSGTPGGSWAGVPWGSQSSSVSLRSSTVARSFRSFPSQSSECISVTDNRSSVNWGKFNSMSKNI